MVSTLDADTRRIAGLFGVKAAMLLYGCEHAQHLQRAVVSRDLIGQAEGVLMERFIVDDDVAFSVLVAAFRDTNVKLIDGTRWLRGEASNRHAEHVALARALDRAAAPHHDL